MLQCKVKRLDNDVDSDVRSLIQTDLTALKLSASYFNPISETGMARIFVLSNLVQSRNWYYRIEVTRSSSVDR